jgi:hypothetical protein
MSQKVRLKDLAGYSWSPHSEITHLENLSLIISTVSREVLHHSVETIGFEHQQSQLVSMCIFNCCDRRRIDFLGLTVTLYCTTAIC